MRNFSLLLSLWIFSAVPGMLSAQQIASYYERNPFLMGAPGTFQNGLLGFANPANSALLKTFNARFYWQTGDRTTSALDNWAFYSGVPGFGFGVQRQEANHLSVKDYRFNLAGGNSAFAMGLAYQWSTGDRQAFQRKKMFSLGALIRPNRRLSVGITGNFSLESSAREGVFELGVRPFANRRLTLFGDAVITRRQQFNDIPWSAGAILEVLPGIHLTGRYFDSQAFTVGVNISLGRSYLSGQGHFDDNSDHRFNSYSVGFGDYTPSLISRQLMGTENYVALNLKGRVDYQKFRLFDSQTIRFNDLLREIRLATADPRISAIAVSLSGLRILPEHAWEVRETLREARQKGKKVFIFIDNASMTLYHLASVADVVIMDPQGLLSLPGYVMGRTFLKGTLEKMGLGFDEWRFFKYKSAAEVLSRDRMSPADREQRQAFIDDLYQLIRQDVSSSRKFTETGFDSLVNQQVYFLAEDALKLGLVDTLARWSSMQDIIQHYTGHKKRRLPLSLIFEEAPPAQLWGMPPKIALVYGIGVCAMDEGIKARWLEKVFLRLKDDRSVKAVVFRVDSPGGDGMASDVVAEAMRKCAEKKPVVVSQGQVAGSGGYWISMYADTIVAAPNTITGSIGVIGGWVYDKGISAKLGMTSDHVKVGEHADLGYGVRLPLLGVQIPARNLTDAERQRVEVFFKRLYRDFVNKVAAGRGIPADSVEQIARGRFYSGIDGKQLGLVDEIGGLYTAIGIARKLAHIPEKRYYEIVEIPRYKGLFDSNLINPFATGEQLQNDPVIQFLRMFTRQPGYPLPMMLPGEYPVLEEK